MWLPWSLELHSGLSTTIPMLPKILAWDYLQDLHQKRRQRAVWALWKGGIEQEDAPTVEKLLLKAASQ